MAPKRPQSAVSKVPGPGAYDLTPKEKQQGPTHMYVLVEGVV